MASISFLKSFSLSLIAGLVLSVGLCLTPLAEATRLPSNLQAYLYKKDPDVKIRFDGLIVFTNGQNYVPVLPQNFHGTSQPTNVVKQWPASADYPDMIQFDNNLFLLRLIPTSTDKLTLPRLDTYPMELKEGLLPQDFVLPGSLSIPSELRVLLGTLDYGRPQTLPDELMTLESIKPEGSEGNSTKSAKPQQQPVLYVVDVNQAQVAALQPNSGNSKWALPLNCLPTSLAVSKIGDKLYTSCLGRDEVLIIDTQANLITQRLKLSHEPSLMYHFQQVPWLATAERYDKALTLISTKTQQKEEALELPASIVSITGRPDSPVLYAAEANGKRLFEIDITGKQLVRTLNDEKQHDYLKDATSLWVQPERNTLGFLWMTSKKKQIEIIPADKWKDDPTYRVNSENLQVIDLLTGNLLRTASIGKKPMGFFPGPDAKLYIPCADSDRVDVFDTQTFQPLESIVLPTGTFPSSVSFTADGRRLLVASAGSEKLLVIDLSDHSIENVITLPYRPVAMEAYFGETPDYLDWLENPSTINVRLAKAGKESVVESTQRMTSTTNKPIKPEPLVLNKEDKKLDVPSQGVVVPEPKTIENPNKQKDSWFNIWPFSSKPVRQESLDPREASKEKPEPPWEWWPFARRGQQSDQTLPESEAPQ